MIKVEVKYRGEIIESVEITGHADSAAKGKDLVCAGVSAIAIGSLNALESLIENSKSKANAKLQMKENLITIKVLKSSNELQLVLNTMLIQLKTVEENSNKYIKIEEV